MGIMFVSLCTESFSAFFFDIRVQHPHITHIPRYSRSIRGLQTTTLSNAIQKTNIEPNN